MSNVTGFSLHSYRSYPRAILHIDGDCFFASCEVAKNPALRGKPVVTGQERGIASSMTYEAKRMGVTRGMRLFEIKKICPDVIILPSDYETYSLYSERMYNIVRRYTSDVEEYSIDECFADLTGLRRPLHMSYEMMAERIKRELNSELGMTFSVGLSATKVLSKVASKWAKPDGLTFIPLRKAPEFLAKVPTEKIWGIGSQTSALLAKYGVRTALDFALRDESWVRSHVSKPYFEIWQELHGRVVYELNLEPKHIYKSISKTKTFTPPRTDRAYIFSQLSKNIENACIKARRHGLATPLIYFFLKTQDFRYHGMAVLLSAAVSVPQEIIAVVEKVFEKVYRPRTQYRATGIILMKLQENIMTQMDLFGKSLSVETTKKIYISMDTLSAKFGKHAVFLGSSFQAMTEGTHKGERGVSSQRAANIFKGETKRKRLHIPMLGEVK
ncbi:MAG TPA: DNA polymerase IV [Candidatus Paceibacterota bacterium]|nr:DNA polymerase IV [Candidatus Paceibacterota bacterium]